MAVQWCVVRHRLMATELPNDTAPPSLEFMWGNFASVLLVSQCLLLSEFRPLLSEILRSVSCVVFFCNSPNRVFFLSNSYHCLSEIRLMRFLCLVNIVSHYFIVMYDKTLSCCCSTHITGIHLWAVCTESFELRAFCTLCTCTQSCTDSFRISLLDKCSLCINFHLIAAVRFLVSGVFSLFLRGGYNCIWPWDLCTRLMHVFAFCYCNLYFKGLSDASACCCTLWKC